MALELGPQRLASVIRANIALTIAAGTFTVTMSLVVGQLTWLTLTGVLVLLTAVAQYAALRTLRAGDMQRALLIYSLATWFIALTASTIVTFQWPIQVVVAFLPTVLAATFMPEQRIVGYVVASTTVALGVAAVGLFQDVTGLSEDIPDWLRTLVQALVFPGFAALVVLAIVQHHRRVNDLLAVAQDRADDLTASRQRLIQATDRARQRIERDLHDGAQSHLIGIDLQLVRALTLDDLDETRTAIRSIQSELQRAHGELRELAHGLFPPVLAQHGLVSAIQEAIDRFPAHIRLDVKATGRTTPDVEAACYFCILEALQNAVKHAPDATITVTLRRDGGDGTLRAVVADDGPGLPETPSNGQGLDNMRDRIGAIGGEVSLRSTRPRGTEVVAVVPWPSA